MFDQFGFRYMFQTDEMLLVLRYEIASHSSESTDVTF